LSRGPLRPERPGGIFACGSYSTMDMLRPDQLSLCREQQHHAATKH
jgi:hypothetical protein